MKNLKKVLSLVLALAMAASLMTFAFAADASDYDDYGDVTYNEAVDVMTAAGIFNGTGDGSTFSPNGTLTREQAAKIITYMMLGQTQADKLVTTIAPYSDVAATRWSAGAIAYCTNEGIIAGTGNGTFNPTAPVTGLEFGKMLLTALGYDAEIENLVGATWAINTATKMYSIGLDDGLENVALSNALTREQAAQMAFTAMQTPLVEYDSRTSVDINGAQVSIGNTKAEYVTTEIAKTQTISDTKLSNTNAYTIEFAERYCQDLVLDGDYNALEQPVNVWSYDGDEIGTYAVGADKVAVVADKDKTIEDVLLGSSYMNYSNRDLALTYTTGTGSSVATHYNVYINGAQQTGVAPELTKGDVVYAYENNDGDVERVVVASYEYAKIDSVATNMSTTEKDNGASYRVKLVDIDDNAAGTYYDVYDNDAKVLNGFDASAYTEDTVLAIAVNGDGSKEIVDSYVADVVTGKPTAVTEYDSTVATMEREDGSITIDGAKYNFSNNITGVVADFDFDNEYAVYTTAEGYAIGITGVTAADVNDLYYVTGVYAKASTYGETNLVYYAQRVSLADGAMDTVQVEKGALQAIGNNTTVTVDTDITQPDSKNWAGLYTFNDKRVAEDTANHYDEQKAGNGIYTMVPFADDSAVTADFGEKNTTISSSVKVDDTKIATAAGTYYVNADTKYLAVESLGSGIDVSYAQGGMKITVPTTDTPAPGTPVPVNTIVVYDADDGKTAVAVIYVGGSLSTSVSTQDVVYLATKPTSKASNDNWNATLYYMEDNSTKDVVVDDDYAQGFYVYSETDGVLKLESADALTLTAAYDDEAGSVLDLTIDDVYKTSLFSTTATHFNDIRFNDVMIVDNRSQSAIDGSLYPVEITTIADLKEAIAAGGNVVADVYFNDGATFIAIDSVGNRGNSAVDYVEGTSYNWRGATVTVNGNDVTATGASNAYKDVDPAVDARTAPYIADLAQFLGGLYRSGAASTIEFNGHTYTWDTASAGNLAGSNWYGNSQTLVKAIDTYWGPVSADHSYNVTLTVDGVEMTYTVVIPA